MKLKIIREIFEADIEDSDNLITSVPTFSEIFFHQNKIIGIKICFIHNIIRNNSQNIFKSQCILTNIPEDHRKTDTKQTIIENEHRK